MESAKMATTEIGPGPNEAGTINETEPSTTGAGPSTTRTTIEAGPSTTNERTNVIIAIYKPLDARDPSHWALQLKDSRRSVILQVADDKNGVGYYVKAPLYNKNPEKSRQHYLNIAVGTLDAKDFDDVVSLIQTTPVDNNSTARPGIARHGSLTRSHYLRQKGKSAWFLAGPALDFPNIQPPEDAAEVISTPRLCGDSRLMPGCKVFHVTEDTATARTEAREVSMDDVVLAENTDALKDQVLVYRYKGRFIAVDHKCPHMSYPLSTGTPFDIEDFGIVLSAGLTCPKHGWSFDMFTGTGDRGNYKLKVWETEVRDQHGVVGTGDTTGLDAADAALVGKEVWVRKKQRIG